MANENSVSDPWSAASFIMKAMAPDYLKDEYQPPQIGPETPPGKVGPGEPNIGPWAAADLAGYIPSAGAKVGAGLMKAIFAGPMAKGADLHALKNAKELVIGGLEKGMSGKDLSEIARQETGWFLGPEGKWKYEIPDNQARASSEGLLKQQIGENPSLSEIMHHSKLYDAYPELKDLEVRSTTSPGTAGWYAEKEIAQREGLGSDKMMGISPELHPTRRLGTILHESQHAVQDIEGFHPGASVQGMQTIGDMALKKMGVETPLPSRTLINRDKAARQAYLEYAGEAEARNTAARETMTPQERAFRSPFDYIPGIRGHNSANEFVPLEKQLVANYYMQKQDPMTQLWAAVMRGK